MSKIKNLSDLVEMSLRENVNKTMICDFTVEVDGQMCQVYDASVSYRDVLLFTNRGTVTYLVDSYGDRHVAELFDWDFDPIEDSSIDDASYDQSGNQIHGKLE